MRAFAERTEGMDFPWWLVLLFNVWVGVAAPPIILGAVGIIGGGLAIAIAFVMRSMDRGASVRDDSGTEGGGEVRPV